MSKKTEKRNNLKILIIIILHIVNHVKGKENNNSLIYILMWTTSKLSPFAYMDMEQQYFIKQKCRYQNCFITDNKMYFDTVTDYDVILFNAVNLTDLERPLERTEKQIYVLVSDEPPIYYPVPPNYNGFFNWTWTYKLDSDINLRYLIVKNKNGEVIGPKLNMHWMDDMKPVSKSIKRKLRTKKKAVAWFVSHCKTPSQREVYAETLSDELGKYSLKVDTYGLCGLLECDKGNIAKCYAMLASDYYFYLSFENSMGEDYVTEKLLTPLQHYVVPVVYGGANYTRFMPRGIYLDAMAMRPEELAGHMHRIIQDKNKYYNFFKWRRYYSYHSPREGADTDEVCAFCALLNNKERMNKKSVYRSITRFWKD